MNTSNLDSAAIEAFEREDLPPPGSTGATRPIPATWMR